ncbi:DUF2878 domain-containing protein [Psychromonas sp. MB-3u-54]|uniref:DUF2878 domain-containing protein n=1 Tax=Psychromonas sp. MB-3u-54 TaxID=2058319 RepID=UPI000CA68214|nr:DUF2878 domain-containing protein [Psychromonas sp. MB-3u-54]PKH02923.1 DUF2878 domain-containing protein [Psychromonas sp. MB-3u-54]
MRRFIVSHFYWFNFIWFQLMWFIAVFFTVSGQLFLIFSLLLHFYLSPDRKFDLASLITISAIGGTVDLLLSWLGIMVFPEATLLPLWLVLLWAHFAVALNHGMSWLNQIPLYFQVMFGGLFGPLSYYAGYKFGAVDFPLSPLQTSLILIVIWATLLPVYLFISRNYGDRYDNVKQKHS